MTKRMNPVVKAKWLDALRSGKFKKGSDYLTKVVNDDSSQQCRAYCCLGVLTEIYAEEHGKISDFHNRGLRNITKRNHPIEVLCTAVQRWAGLEENNPKVSLDADENYPELQTLALLNDGGCSFSRIADLIEEQL